MLVKLPSGHLDVVVLLPEAAQCSHEKPSRGSGARHVLEQDAMFDVVPVRVLHHEGLALEIDLDGCIRLVHIVHVLCGRHLVRESVRRQRVEQLVVCHVDRPPTAVTRAACSGSRHSGSSAIGRSSRSCLTVCPTASVVAHRHELTTLCLIQLRQKTKL